MEYPKDPKYAAYFFRRHSFEELRAWTETMRFFRFCRAIGGHANDGDLLVAAVRVESQADLAAVAAALGIAPRAGQAEIAGVRCFVAVHPGQLELWLSGAAGDAYEVSEEDVLNAVKIEAALASVADRVIDPPMAGERCFTR
jgi:hypothetical protein